MIRLFPFRKDDRPAYPARRRAKDRRYLILGAAFAGLFLLTIAQLGEDGLATLFRLKSRETELSAEVKRLENQNRDLDRRLQGLAQDPEVLEKLAREEHNMKKSDEEVLTVLPAEDGETGR